MTVSIRRAVPADAEVLSALAERLFVETFVEDFAVPYPAADLAAYLAKANGPAVLRARLADDKTAAWLAEDQSAAVGYALACPAKLPHADLRQGDGMLDRLYLDRAYRGFGLADRLMDLALAWMQARFAPRPWLSVHSDNIRAQRYYARYGFELCGEYGYPVGQWLDREFIMRRH